MHSVKYLIINSKVTLTTSTNNISTDTGMNKLLNMYNLTTDMHLTKNSTVVELTANNFEVEGLFRILILTLVLLSINGQAPNKNLG